MSHLAPPTALDVTNLLLNLPAPIVLPSGFDVASCLSAAIAEWNRRTRYLPFFQTNATPVQYPIDPPGPDSQFTWIGGSRKLLLDNGLISVTSIYVGAQPSVGNAGQLLTLGSDYWLEPGNARVIQPDPEPYTRVRFSWVQRGLPQSILITGIWGYCVTGIPDDAWEGMLFLAGSFVLDSVLQGIFASPTTIKIGSATVTQDSFRDLGAAWANKAEVIAARYRLQR